VTSRLFFLLFHSTFSLVQISWTPPPSLLLSNSLASFTRSQTKLVLLLLFYLNPLFLCNSQIFLSHIERHRPSYIKWRNPESPPDSLFFFLNAFNIARYRRTNKQRNRRVERKRRGHSNPQRLERRKKKKNMYKGSSIICTDSCCCCCYVQPVYSYTCD
jgi:hypothetical protein